MSRKGECYDNAVVESSFHTLQVERVYLQDYPNHPEVTADRFEYIEVFYKVFYSRQRRHSRLGQHQSGRLQRLPARRPHIGTGPHARNRQCGRVFQHIRARRGKLAETLTGQATSLPRYH